MNFRFYSIITMAVLTLFTTSGFSQSADKNAPPTVKRPDPRVVSNKKSPSGSLTSSEQTKKQSEEEEAQAKREKAYYEREKTLSALRGRAMGSRSEIHKNNLDPTENLAAERVQVSTQSEMSHKRPTGKPLSETAKRKFDVKQQNNAKEKTSNLKVPVKRTPTAPEPTTNTKQR